METDGRQFNLDEELTAISMRYLENIEPLHLGLQRIKQDLKYLVASAKIFRKNETLIDASVPASYLNC